MARGAVLVARIGHVVCGGLLDDALARAAEAGFAVVAFQAHGKGRRARQQPSVRGPVRHVAGLATVDPHGRMLINEWPTFIGVAFEAGFFIGLRLVDHLGPESGSPSRGGSAMRIVAIGTLDNAFVYAMLEWHRELRSYGGVAAVAEFGLLLREEVLGRLRLMNRVAVCADDVFLGVRASADVGARKSLRMAAQACVQNLLRR